ncbi:PREDICTED: very low-density lipoprotein receptor-like, partial [Rhagoletis zephyria]|uniref:very low-density lipoprotein receptor-like n=1 Tax=Rhagoletis zephyria TaxID=28612 RepID=UPI000811291B
MRRFQIALLFSIALYRSFKCVISATECESNERWQCSNGDCIHMNTLCDGSKHCSDGSDETEEFCKNTLCTPISYRCDYGACIALSLLCDGVADCVDASDEDSEKCRKRREEVPPDEVDDETNRHNCAG